MEGVRTVPELRGIIPNSFAHVFGHIAKKDGDIRQVDNKIIVITVEAYIYRLTHSASELSGFPCMSSLTMNHKILSSLLVNECR